MLHPDDILHKQLKFRVQDAAEEAKFVEDAQNAFALSVGVQAGVKHPDAHDSFVSLPISLALGFGTFLGNLPGNIDRLEVCQHGKEVMFDESRAWAVDALQLPTLGVRAYPHVHQARTSLAVSEQAEILTSVDGVLF